MNHHHNGYECDDQSCSCHGNDPEALVNNSLILSRTGEFLGKSRTMGEIEKCVSGVLLKVAELLAVDGFVLGHIKAVIRAENSVCSVSVTRTGVGDIVYIAGNPSIKPEKWSLTVNVISTASTDAPVDQLLDALFEQMYFCKVEE